MDTFPGETDVRLRPRSVLEASHQVRNLQPATPTVRGVFPPLNFISDESEDPFPSGCAQPIHTPVHGHLPPQSPQSKAAVGPTFLGCVYTMGDDARKQIVALGKVRELPGGKLFPPFLGALSRTPLGAVVERGLLWWVNRGREKPHFEFFLSKERAGKHVKDVQKKWLVSPDVSQSGVIECPLQEAYNCTKIDGDAFKLIPDRKQLREAKRIIKKHQGRRAAKSFRGTPVFAAHNFNIVVPSSEGVQWYTPCFLDKSQLRAALDRSVDLHFEGLIRTRRTQRYGPLDPGTPPGGLGGNPSDNEGFDDESGLLDPSDMKDLMEEAPPGASVGVDKILFTLASVYVQDLFDDLVLGNKWGRTAVGLQPRFTITVDSFEDCAAAAEAAAIAKDRLQKTKGFRGPEIGRLQGGPPVSSSFVDAVEEVGRQEIQPSEGVSHADKGATRSVSSEADVRSDVSTSGQQWWEVIMEHPAFKREALSGEKPTNGVVVNRGPGWAIVRRGPFWNRQYVLEQDAEASKVEKGPRGETNGQDESSASKVEKVPRGESNGQDESAAERRSSGDVAESTDRSAQAAANEEKSGAQKIHWGRKPPPFWSQRGSGSQPGSGRFIDQQEWDSIKASIEAKLKQQGASVGADSRQQRWEAIKASIESKLAAKRQEEGKGREGEQHQRTASDDHQRSPSNDHQRAFNETPHLSIDARSQKRERFSYKKHPKAAGQLGTAGVIRHEARMALIAVEAGSPQERDLQAALDAVSRDIAKKADAETSVMFIANMNSLFEPVGKGTASLPKGPAS